MKKIMMLFSGWAFAGVILVVLGCSTARRSEPLAGPMRLEEPGLVAGYKVFSMHCHQCHPGGEGGLGPALNNKPLPGFLIRYQIRRGLGVMPAFSEEQIAEREMDELLSYLKALRQHPAATE